MKFVSGGVFSTRLIKYGNSWAFVFTKELRDYLKLPCPESDELAVKLDAGKHGNFIGIGKAKN